MLEGDGRIATGSSVDLGEWRDVRPVAGGNMRSAPGSVVDGGDWRDVASSVAEADIRVASERQSEHEDAGEHPRELLPFTRQIVAAGAVAGSLEASMAAAGVPGAAMLEALEAFAASIDLAREVRDGDRFHVRYERTFSVMGTPIGQGRVLWAELVTAGRGTVAIHRFRTHDRAERLWLANGQSTTSPLLRLPLDIVSISSGFGLRADPFDQPPPPPTAGKSSAMGGPSRAPPAHPPGLKALVNPAERPLSSSGLSFYGNFGSADWRAAPRPARPMFMHEGVDFVAPSGTPVFAAADGVVVGAGPNGRYGNWIRINHAGKLATVYGHLSGFAPGIAAGSIVSRGELIGFVGSTGRSTSTHLHFELLADGKPVNPISHPVAKRDALSGPDLNRLRKKVTQNLAERGREAAVTASVSR
jgi:murein DD-endopeptidase MepM/ murein hydrolase activator NlpD